MENSGQRLVWWVGGKRIRLQRPSHRLHLEATVKICLAAKLCLCKRTDKMRIAQSFQQGKKKKFYWKGCCWCMRFSSKHRSTWQRKTLISHLSEYFRKVWSLIESCRQKLKVYTGLQVLESTSKFFLQLTRKNNNIFYRIAAVSFFLLLCIYPVWQKYYHPGSQ